MTNEDLKAIRAAVAAHHGGFDPATDAQVLTLWHALDAATQQRYLHAGGQKTEASGQKTGK